MMHTISLRKLTRVNAILVAVVLVLLLFTTCTAHGALVSGAGLYMQACSSIVAIAGYSSMEMMSLLLGLTSLLVILFAISLRRGEEHIRQQSLTLVIAGGRMTDSGGVGTYNREVVSPLE